MYEYILNLERIEGCLAGSPAQVPSRWRKMSSILSQIAGRFPVGISAFSILTGSSVHVIFFTFPELKSTQALQQIKRWRKVSLRNSPFRFLLVKGDSASYPWGRAIKFGGGRGRGRGDGRGRKGKSRHFTERCSSTNGRQWCHTIFDKIELSNFMSFHFILSVNCERSNSLTFQVAITILQNVLKSNVKRVKILFKSSFEK